MVVVGDLVPKLRPILCDLMDCSPPASLVHGISQARILKWVAISFSVSINNIYLFSTSGDVLVFYIELFTVFSLD